MEDKALRFYSSEQLGATQSFTPDGFLLCEHVPIARTGTLFYADGEVPIEADRDGIIRVTRDAAEVFSPIAIASFAGKPLTNDHPPEKVAPANWKDYSVGVVLNPRRGDGYKYSNDFLYADFLVQDQEAIDDVRKGKREVSAGYDAHYETVRPGEGRQHFIVGNHVALVEKGRCGPLCSIGDKEMSNTKRPAWFDAALRAHQTGDESTLVDTLEKIKDMLGTVYLGLDNPGKMKAGAAIANRDSEKEDKDDDKDEKSDTKDLASMVKDAVSKHMATYDSQIQSLQRAVAILATQDADKSDEKEDKKEDKDDDKDEKKESKEDTKDAEKEDDDKKDDKDKEDTKDRRATVGDSTSLRGMWQDVISRAEILAPGIRMPTFDAKQSAKLTIDAVCQFRRRVLTESLKEEDTKLAITSLAGPKLNLAQMTCDSVAMLYNGASELVKQSTRDQTNPGDGRNYHDAGVMSLVDTVKQINVRNREKFGIKA